jgi:hypothetical protein
MGTRRLLKIFNDILNKGYDLKKIGISHCFTDTKDIPAKKGDIGYDGNSDKRKIQSRSKAFWVVKI